MTLTKTKNKPATGASMLSALALGCSLLVLLLLGIRQLISLDLGYHLAFGETFFDSGTIVDHTPFLYTLPPADTPVSERPEPGPGSWYDGEGRFRFTNSSWLSQVFMYGSWRLAGITGVILLQILLIAGLSAPLAIAMRRSRLPAYLIASTLLLTGLIISFRLNMRPELFGYLCLVIHYMMLARLTMQTDEPITPSWSWAAGMIAVQLFCVNFHSYFILNLAITGAVLTEYILHALKIRMVDRDSARGRTYTKVASRLGMTLAGMVLVGFINPWGWRLVFQPFQTILYMKKYNIGGANPGNNPHPWDYILELRETLSANFPAALSDYAIIIMLVLAAAAVVLQLTAWFVKRRRKRSDEDIIAQRDTFNVRWAHLFMMAGMLFVGLQLRRNIGVASLIVIPSALICFADGCRYLLGDKLARFRLQQLILANTAVIALSVYGGYQIVSGKFYEADGLPTRFGFGISDTILPIGASHWLNEYAPEARVWCDFSSSSTLRFFTRPHKELPILSNTWAYPPAIMAENQFYRKAMAPFSIAADRYGIDAVVLRSDWSLPLHRQLGADPDWKIVQVEGVHVLYLRTNNKYATLAAEHEIRPDNFDMDSFVARELEKDPSFKRAILAVSDTLKEAGELDLAINVIGAGLEYQSPNLIIWEALLNLYSSRGTQRRESGDKRFIDDFKRMEYVMRRISELDPGYFAIR